MNTDIEMNDKKQEELAILFADIEDDVIEILFAGIEDDVIIPSKNEEDSGYDIYAYFEQENLIIQPHTTVKIPTGLYSVIPKGYMMALKERGSTGTKGIAQRAGEIDSGYRGEWLVPINNTNDKPLLITKITNKIELENLSEEFIIRPYSKGICQARLELVPKSKVVKTTVDYIKSCKSIRGEGKLGSSGK